MTGDFRRRCVTLNPMPSFAGILVNRGAERLEPSLESVGAVFTSHVATGSNVLILASGIRSAATETESAAARLSAKGHSTFAIHADTMRDEYVVAHYKAGACARHISFQRDAAEGAQWELVGEPEEWEADLLFALPTEDFVAYLSDDESYTEADLERARLAHEAHSLAGLTRRPPLLAASLWEWLAKKGIDPRTPTATFRKTTLWKRLFGRNAE